MFNNRFFIDSVHKITSGILRDYYELEMLLNADDKTVNNFISQTIKKASWKTESLFGDKVTKVFTYSNSTPTEQDYHQKEYIAANIIDSVFSLKNSMPFFGSVFYYSNERSAKQSKYSAAAIYLPVFKETYYASTGHGARCERIGVEKRIIDNHLNRPNKVLLTNVPNLTQSDLLKYGVQSKDLRIISLGGAYISCMMAHGKADYLVIDSIDKHSICAHKLILNEAGFQMTYESDSGFVYCSTRVL